MIHAALALTLTLGAQALTRGPYLQQGTPGSVVIVWRTDLPSDARVAIGPSPGALSVVHEDPAQRTQHEVRVTGLAPATRYFYAVGTTSAVLAGADSDHFVVTSPDVASRGSFRAWVLGDSGTGDSAQRGVLDAMLAHTALRRPDVMLHMGDMAYDDGTEMEFQVRFFDPMQDILRNTVVWPTIGNHEGHTSTSSSQSGPYYDAYVLPSLGEAGGLPSGTEAYYAFDHANVHFVVLDSVGSSLDPVDAMMTWLRADLAATTQEWVVAYWHHPPYSMGTHDSDSDGDLIRMRVQVLPTVEAAGVDLVLCGHSHVYEHSGLMRGAYETPSVVADHVLQGGDGKVGGDGPYAKEPGRGEGTLYVVSGNGGRPVNRRGVHPLLVFAEADYGSVMLDVERNVINVQNLRHDGVITNSIFLLKGDAIVLGSPNGGEKLGAGSTIDITWSAPPTIPSVMLELSDDGGATWSIIAPSLPNNGRHTWHVPSAVIPSAILRVSNAADASIHDESNAPFSVVDMTQQDAIPPGSNWRFHDSAEAPPADWMTPSFDDSAWSMGRAQLGYGEGDEVTQLLDADPNVPTVYFRQSFTLDETPTSAMLRAIVDDGLAVFVNGTLVTQAHVGNGLAHDVFASELSSDNESISVALADPSLLQPGRNVVAALVKQVSDSSSDLSFDLSLHTMHNALLSNRAPVVIAPGSQLATVDNAWQLQLDAHDDDGDVLTFRSSDLPQGVVLGRVTGLLEWTPTLADVGLHAFSVEVRDAQTARVTVMVLIDVVEPELPDASMPDPPDASEPPDAFVAGVPDAAMSDAAPAPDAFVPDAAAPNDASMPDTSQPPDASISVVDAASPVDAAGTPDAAREPEPRPSGCHCDASSSWSGWSLFALLAILRRSVSRRETR